MKEIVLWLFATFSLAVWSHPTVIRKASKLQENDVTFGEDAHGHALVRKRRSSKTMEIEQAEESTPPPDEYRTMVVEPSGGMHVEGQSHLGMRLVASAESAASADSADALEAGTSQHEAGSRGEATGALSTVSLSEMTRTILSRKSVQLLVVVGVVAFFAVCLFQYLFFRKKTRFMTAGAPFYPTAPRVSITRSSRLSVDGMSQPLKDSEEETGGDNQPPPANSTKSGFIWRLRKQHSDSHADDLEEWRRTVENRGSLRTSSVPQIMTDYASWDFRLLGLFQLKETPHGLALAYRSEKDQREKLMELRPFGKTTEYCARLPRVSMTALSEDAHQTLSSSIIQYQLAVSDEKDPGTAGGVQKDLPEFLFPLLLSVVESDDDEDTDGEDQEQCIVLATATPRECTEWMEEIQKVLNPNGGSLSAMTTGEN